VYAKKRAGNPRERKGLKKDGLPAWNTKGGVDRQPNPGKLGVMKRIGKEDKNKEGEMVSPGNGQIPKHRWGTHGPGVEGEKVHQNDPSINTSQENLILGASLTEGGGTRSPATKECPGGGEKNGVG